VRVPQSDAYERFDVAAWYEKTYGRVVRSRKDLHRYQRKAVRFLYDNPFSALFIDLGMGKSVICLTLLADLLNEGWTGKALVIAPLRVAKATWPEEIAEWKQAAGIEYSLIRAEDDDDEIKATWEAVYRPAYEYERRVGETPAYAQRVASRKAAPARLAAKEAMRVRQTLSDAQLHIINIERLEWLVQFWEKRGRETGEKWPYDTVIIDESSKFKDYTTKRYKALKKCLSRIERLHCLTASPAAESYQHIFAQIFLLDRGQRFGRFITHYMKRYFHEIKLGNSRARKWKIKPGSEEKISAKMADICLVMKSRDYREQLKIEDWLPLKRPIYLNDDLMDRYDDFEDTMILKLDEKRIEAANGAALFNKLLQMTAGAVYDEEKSVVPVHDEKIEALKELIDELKGEPLLVCYWFKSSLARLRKAIPGLVVMDKGGRCVADWNAGKIKVLAIQPGGAAHGLNMQKGPGHDIAFFDMCWSRELYEQVIGRLSRQGQRNIVRVHHLLCIGTADEIVYECLQDKGAGQERLFEFIRKARARIAANDNSRVQEKKRAA
jgi:SNF2 family DNA or RNA helicase